MCLLIRAQHLAISSIILGIQLCIYLGSGQDKTDYLFLMRTLHVQGGQLFTQKNVYMGDLYIANICHITCKYDFVTVAFVIIVLHKCHESLHVATFVGYMNYQTDINNSRIIKNCLQQQICKMAYTTTSTYRIVVVLNASTVKDNFNTVYRYM